MTIENAVRILAGTMVLLSLGLSLWLGPWGLLLAGFVALNLIQSALTGFCPAEGIFRRLGMKGTSCAAPSKLPPPADPQSEPV